MTNCFISDLHLQEDRPDITQAFLSFLEETASKAEKLYIPVSYTHLTLPTICSV